MLAEMNKIYVAKSKDIDDDQYKINFMNELIDVVHQTAESDLRPEKAKDILIGPFFSRNLFYYFCICVLFNKKLYVVCTFYICICLVKTLYQNK